jgi:hypothetical protein
MKAKQTSQTLLAEIRKAAAEAPRMYFAPLIGAVRGIRSQYRQIDAPRRHEAEQILREQPD